MPTATATQELLSDGGTSILSLKPSKPSSKAAESSTAATLRSLYSRAAKAFLHRDFALTHSLLTSAFGFISPPVSTPEDEIAVYRRKWDILRITVETTVYSSPPTSDAPDVFPPALRANQLLSPQSLVNSLYTRSLQLFTPSSPPHKATAAFLPHPILCTLVLASVKLGCCDVGRGMIEDWLARRPEDSSAHGLAGYTKVLELYCLQVLPRLGEWEYAQDFLHYEGEMEVDVRQNIMSALSEIRQQALETRQARLPTSSALASPTLSPSSASSSRTVSPARSDSSSSTHTATPRTPNPPHNKSKSKGKASNGALNGLSQLTPSSSSSSTSSLSTTSDATSKTVTPSSVDRSRSTARRELGKDPAKYGDAVIPRSSAASSIARSLPSSSSSGRIATSPGAVRAPTALALIRSYIQSVLRNASKSTITAFFVIFVVFPLMSLVLRIRRRNTRITSGQASSAADAVRRRLRSSQAGTAAGAGFVSAIWSEMVKAIGDTIRMGGGGLA